MNTSLRILRYELRDLLRSRWLIGYFLFFIGFAETLHRIQGGSSRVLLNLVDVVLLLIPLASGVFGAIYLYGAREFSELLLSQPVGRRQLFSGLYLGLATSLSAAFVLGTASPFLLHGMDTPEGWATLGAICLAGTALTWISVALAFLVALRLEDRMKGLATVILGWLALAVVYDGAVLLALNAFSDLPAEPGLLAATLANPVDLARVVLLLRFDIAALMGYTGEAFSRFLGGATGALTAALTTTLWLALPVALGARLFRRKDF